MAGDNFKFQNELTNSYKKIFANKLSMKAQEMLTPTNDEDRAFFDNLGKRQSLHALQTPQNSAGRLIDTGNFRNSDSQKKSDPNANTPPEAGQKKAKPFNFPFESIMERQIEDEGRSMTSKMDMLRRDPHEEFFKLTLLAFKLNNKVSNTVLMVSAGLYYLRRLTRMTATLSV